VLRHPRGQPRATERKAGLPPRLWHLAKRLGKGSRRTCPEEFLVTFSCKGRGTLPIMWSQGGGGARGFPPRRRCSGQGPGGIGGPDLRTLGQLPPSLSMRSTPGRLAVIRGVNPGALCG